jgi:hypothetical protein
MYEVVLYLCLHHDNTVFHESAFGSWPIVWCTEPEQNAPIHTGERFKVEEDCLIVGWIRLNALQKQPSWQRLTVAYRCERVNTL